MKKALSEQFIKDFIKRAGSELENLRMGMSARKDFRVKLADNLRSIKYQSKALARAEMSTRFLAAARREQLELLHSNEDVIKSLKAMAANKRVEIDMYNAALSTVMLEEASKEEEK